MTTKKINQYDKNGFFMFTVAQCRYHDEEAIFVPLPLLALS